MLGPKEVELKLQELAGTVLLFGLVAGLGIGSSIRCPSICLRCDE